MKDNVKVENGVASFRISYKHDDNYVFSSDTHYLETDAGYGSRWIPMFLPIIISRLLNDDWTIQFKMKNKTIVGFDHANDLKFHQEVTLDAKNKPTIKRWNSGIFVFSTTRVKNIVVNMDDIEEIQAVVHSSSHREFTDAPLAQMVITPYTVDGSPDWVVDVSTKHTPLLAKVAEPYKEQGKAKTWGYPVVDDCNAVARRFGLSSSYIANNVDQLHYLLVNHKVEISTRDIQKAIDAVKEGTPIVVELDQFRWMELSSFAHHFRAD